MPSRIRSIEEKDRPLVLEMMEVFYASDAVLSNGSREIFEADLDACLCQSPYLEGYVFEENGILQGYAMVAKSFSTEYGRPCIWIEDLYLRQDCRGQGIGSGFLRYIEEKYPKALLRLEVEEENAQAVHTYEKAGFQILPYMEMKKLRIDEAL